MHGRVGIQNLSKAREHHRDRRLRNGGHFAEVQSLGHGWRALKGVTQTCLVHVVLDHLFTRQSLAEVSSGQNRAVKRALHAGARRFNTHKVYGHASHEKHQDQHENRENDHGAIFTGLEFTQVASDARCNRLRLCFQCLHY